MPGDSVHPPFLGPWSQPLTSGVPLFALDDMEEHVWWERIEGEIQRACAQLTSVRETLSSGMELEQGFLEALGKGVLPFSGVSLLVFSFYARFGFSVPFDMCRSRSEHPCRSRDFFMSNAAMVRGSRAGWRKLSGS
jgi:hypothetical protein